MRSPNETGMEKLLVKENLKKTKARKLVLEALKNSPPKTAGEIYSLVREKMGKLSLSTVYRVCETLVEKGIL